MSSEIFVLVPSYNHAPFVERCLKSIINQSLQPKKLLVIDDGSKDNSVEIIDRVLKNCPFDAELIAREYLEPLKRAKVDVLVLGCTHYPLLKPLLARVMGPDVTLVDSAEETATAVSRELERLDLLANGGTHDHRFVVSDDEAHFRKVGAVFLGEKLKQVEVVPL